MSKPTSAESAEALSGRFLTWGSFYFRHGWDYEEDTLVFAKHNRAALFDITQTDETKNSSGALWKIDPCFNSVL